MRKLIMRIVVGCLVAACCQIGIETTSIDAAVSGKGTPSSVIILIHGVESDQGTYQQFKRLAKNEFRNSWIVPFEWGSEFLLKASDGVGARANSAFGLSDDGFVAVAKLKEVVARCRDEFDNVPITVVAHSQGTVVSCCALQEGMCVDNWILMGSPLDKEGITYGNNNTYFGRAAGNVRGAIINLHSSDDGIAFLKGGIGRFGLPKQIHGIKERLTDGKAGKIHDVSISGVDHFAGDSWWTMDWMRQNDDRKWTGPIDKSQLRQILKNGRMDATTSVGTGAQIQSQKKAFDKIVKFAAEGTRENNWAHIFGDDDLDEFEYTFTLTPGMSNGIYFDDKVMAHYRVECIEGKCNAKLQFATNSEWDREISLGDLGGPTGFKSISGKEMSKYLKSDATVFLSAKNIASDSIARIKLSLLAWEGTPPAKERLTKYQQEDASTGERKTSVKFKFDRERMIQQLANHEGLRLKCYKDSENIPTIGYGFNLTRSEAKEKIEGLGLNYENVLKKKQALTEKQAKTLLDGDLDTAILDARSFFPGFDSLSGERQRVLVDMAFNLGLPTLKKFKRFYSALEQGKFRIAAKEMRDSRWAKQVGTRAEALARMMEVAGNVDTTGSEQDRVAGMYALVSAAVSELDGESNPEYSKKVTLFLIRVAWHEGAQLTKRRQNRGGPGRSFFQFEPGKAKDAIDYAVSQKVAGRLVSATETNENDLKTASDKLALGKPWPNENLIEKLLGGTKANDYFAVLMARIDLKRFKKSIPNSLDDQAEYWAKYWKRKFDSKEDRAKKLKQFKDNVKKLEQFLQKDKK